MRSILFFSVICATACMGMAGCPPTPPNPPTPDSGMSDVSPPPPPVPTADSAPTPPPPAPTVDAAPPAPMVDSGPPPSTDPCVNACTQMNSVGCAQQADCGKVLGLVNANRTNRNPKTGNALTCSDLVSVKSSADVTANGWTCGGASKKH